MDHVKQHIHITSEVDPAPIQDENNTLPEEGVGADQLYPSWAYAADLKTSVVYTTSKNRSNPTRGGWLKP